MKYNKRHCFSYLFAMFMVINIYNLRAQETVTTTGGNATGSGGAVSYTVGQVAYTNITNTTGTITQGVQQPYEIFVVTGLEEYSDITLEMSVYPNPATDFLKLQVENCKFENLSYQLYDINGILVQNGEIMNKDTFIQTGKLLPAAYYLKVVNNNKELKTFKIIKY